jgi:putative transposase
MNNVNSLSHSKWECRYHVVWIRKCRRKLLFGQLLKHQGEVFHDLACQKDSKILEGHLQQDHVHVLISPPPKYSVAQVVGYIKGKSAIHIACTDLGQMENYGGKSF